ncbi:hypothetical protein [Blastopirellula marina]|uniref:Carboxypeptidase regulatory-like domain-containing protein n=1 Tax=Blastopirellula marina DSM 3645 TaxID=314230 RepID=A3ZX99_9BACT|nr:hypothetical protein [Blastopirellula marina]EAQ78865.1 hypothetical protein DSM3645_30226 [Blastopirellula marina DSM 3645]
MRYVCLVVCFLVSLSLGCSAEERTVDPRHQVSGTVTLDGKPLAEGRIMFSSTEDAARGVPPASVEIHDGQYSLMVTVGKKTVKVSHLVESGRDESTGEPMMKESIPAKFNKDSKLETTVTEGENTADFDLK